MSSSGVYGVYGRQAYTANDKVAPFKALREDLELIKAGTFDTSSMRLVRLSGDIKAEV